MNSYPYTKAWGHDFSPPGTYLDIVCIYLLLL